MPVFALYAPVVKWISRLASDQLLWVRVLPGAPDRNSLRPALLAGRLATNLYSILGEENFLIEII